MSDEGESAHGEVEETHPFHPVDDPVLDLAGTSGLVAVAVETIENTAQAPRVDPGARSKLRSSTMASAAQAQAREEISSPTRVIKCDCDHFTERDKQDIAEMGAAVKALQEKMSRLLKSREEISEKLHQTNLDIKSLHDSVASPIPTIGANIKTLKDEVSDVSAGFRILKKGGGAVSTGKTATPRARKHDPFGDYSF